jgi:hypothetical protein
MIYIRIKSQGQIRHPLFPAKFESREREPPVKRFGRPEKKKDIGF